MRHGAGRSVFEHERGGIATHLTLGIADDAPVKLSLLRVTNTGNRPRRLTVTTYVEWTLGVLREHTQHQVRTAFDRGARRDPGPQHLRSAVRRLDRAFMRSASRSPATPASRREFLGRNGTPEAPAALAATADSAA